MKKILFTLKESLFSTCLYSVDAFYKRLNRLSRNIDYKIAIQTKSILNGREMLELDTSEKGIYVGDFEPLLNGYPLLEKIKLTKDKILISIELDKEYYDINDYYSLRLSDKMEIARVLEEHILLKNYAHL